MSGTVNMDSPLPVGYPHTLGPLLVFTRDVCSCVSITGCIWNTTQGQSRLDISTKASALFTFYRPKHPREADKPSFHGLKASRNPSCLLQGELADSRLLNCHRSVHWHECRLHGDSVAKPGERVGLL